MKDLFVDNCLAGHFANPVLPEYRDLIRWLWEHGSLVVTQHVIKEYIATTGGCKVATCLHAIVDRQTRFGKLHRISKEQLDGFQISPHKTLLSNREDQYHIKAVLLSVRHIALTVDENFATDLRSFPRYGVIVASNPDQIAYI